MNSAIRHTLGAALGRGFVLTGALVAALAVQAQNSEHRKSYEHTAGGDTASCLKEAAQMNMATIKFAQLGSEKAQSSELKEFSAQMEKDHKRAQDKLATIAAKHNVALPTSLSPKCQEELTKLQGLSGDEFDKEFAKGAVEGHAMGIAKLQEASGQAKDADLAQYAKDQLSEMKRHQVKAREVAKAVGLDQATIAALEKKNAEGVGTAGASTETERGASSSKTTDQPERREATPVDK